MNISSLCIYIYYAYKYINYLTIFNFVITSFFTRPPLASINSGGLCTIHNGRNWKICHFAIRRIAISWTTGSHSVGSLTGATIEAGGCSHEAWRDHLNWTKSGPRLLLLLLLKWWSSSSSSTSQLSVDVRRSTRTRFRTRRSIRGGATKSWRWRTC